MTHPSPLEPELARRFALRAERFDHGPLSVELLLPRSADELIDEAAFDADERLPYWADLWPSARALARHLLEAPLPEGPALELGCGVALPSLALRARGMDALATDYDADALLFARANAERNGLAPLATRLVDWRDPPADLPRFPLVVAADVLYEARNADALAALLPRLLAPGGTFLLADPGRVHAGAFRESLLAAGWRVRDLPERREPAAAGQHSRVRMVEVG